MKVGLFAPRTSVNFGGVWQFAQWITFKVGTSVPMHLVLPQSLVDDMAASAPLPRGVTATPVDYYLAPVRSTLAYRALESRAWNRVRGISVPFYDSTAQWLLHRFFEGSMETGPLLADLRQHRVDLLHVPLQSVYHEAVARHFPYVINPHDYQHEHFPEFFTPKQLDARRTRYYRSQRRAAAIVVHSLQTRLDAIRYVGIPEDRVFYAPYGPLATFPNANEVQIQTTLRRYGLPERFIFYPANTWPHKNHIALLEALETLKRNGIEVPCVFTGSGGLHAPAIDERIRALGLDQQVFVLGRLSPRDMGALYGQCVMVVVPSLFEQNSGPMLEAVHFGKAVAVSDIPELVHSLDGAGLVFDPRSPDAIAKAVDHVWSSEANRKEIETAIIKRRAAMSWEPFRDVYVRAYEFALDRGPGA